MMMKLFFLFWIAFFQIPLPVWSWGFFAHKQINRYAITTLPPGMFRFYKEHLTFLTEKSVNPDKRRYVVQDEAVKHFIDLEIYQSSLLDRQKILLDQAIERYGHTVVAVHGQLPWAVINVHRQLTRAFMKRDSTTILKLSADLGHYVADAHVPLHTTQNYDGQLTGQEGIHALWETRLPVLFFDVYNLFVGQASHIGDPLTHIWDIVMHAHALVHKVLSLEKQLSTQYPSVLKYSFEQEGNLLKKQYAVAFATAYHQALEGQVEEQLRQSIIQVGNFWLTAWINAGSPSLDHLDAIIPIQDEADMLVQETSALECNRGCGEA